MNRSRGGYSGPLPRAWTPAGLWSALARQPGLTREQRQAYRRAAAAARAARAARVITRRTT